MRLLRPPFYLVLKEDPSQTGENCPNIRSHFAQTPMTQVSVTCTFNRQYQKQTVVHLETEIGEFKTLRWMNRMIFTHLEAQRRKSPKINKRTDILSFLFIHVYMQGLCSASSKVYHADRASPTTLITSEFFWGKQKTDWKKMKNRCMNIEENQYHYFLFLFTLWWSVCDLSAKLMDHKTLKIADNFVAFSCWNNGKLLTDSAY